MTILLLALLAGSGQAREVRFPNPAPFALPTADYPGSFERAPIPHWEARLPGPPVNAATHTERSRPVVSGGEIYLGSAGGSALYVLSRRDGSLIRSLPADGAVESEPVVQDDFVYFADTGGTTWCYRLDGTLVWRRPSQAPVLVRPTVDHGMVYVTNVADMAFALDAASGEVVWRYEHPADLGREAELALYAAPPAVVHGDLVLLGFSDGAIVALERTSGDEQWNRRIGEGTYPDIVAPVAAHGDEIFASGYLSPLVAYSPATRTVRWRLDVGSAAAPLVREREEGTWLYHPGTDGVLRVIDTRTGDLAWAWDSGTKGSLTEPILTDAGLLIGSSDGTLFLLDPDDGAARWHYHEARQLDGLSASPVVAGRQVLFVTNAGRLYSMIAPRRRVAWPR